MYSFNADDLLEVAIRIEANGAEFYRKAAGLQANPENRDMLEKLAAMEDQHQVTFEKLREQLSDAEKTPTVFDPENDAARYLASMADTHGGEGSPKAADALTGSESLASILETAIGLEKESVLFYVGMKDLIPPQYGQEKLEAIIKEERRHIAQLDAVRKKL